MNDVLVKDQCDMRDAGYKSIVSARQSSCGGGHNIVAIGIESGEPCGAFSGLV